MGLQCILSLESPLLNYMTILRQYLIHLYTWLLAIVSHTFQLVTVTPSVALPVLGA